MLFFGAPYPCIYSLLPPTVLTLLFYLFFFWFLLVTSGRVWSLSVKSTTAMPVQRCIYIGCGGVNSTGSSNQENPVYYIPFPAMKYHPDKHSLWTRLCGLATCLQTPTLKDAKKYTCSKHFIGGYGTY